VDARVSVRISREPAGEWVRVEVTDNGPGVPPDKQAEIFRPFVSTKGSRGTGLGLAVSRKILREHGGDLVLRSIVGKGSTFALRLPLRAATAQESQESMPIQTPVPPPTG
jgi:signal transduction histidine kinase